jgi:hypothetical protein
MSVVAAAGRFLPAVRSQNDGWEYVVYLVAGVAQAVVLRRYLSGTQWWAVVTAVGAALAVALHVGLFAGPRPLWSDAPAFVRDAVTTVADLVFVALAQWLWLRGRVRRALWWLIVNVALAVALALLVLANGGTDEAGGSAEISDLALIGGSALIALIIGTVTGSTLIRLLRAPTVPRT